MRWRPQVFHTSADLQGLKSSVMGISSNPGSSLDAAFWPALQRFTNS